MVIFRKEYSILDCIFCEITSTFYILDIMCWRGHPVFDTETEFRFYWLKTKLQELSALGQATASNPFIVRVFFPVQVYLLGILSLHSGSHFTCSFHSDSIPDLGSLWQSAIQGDTKAAMTFRTCSVFTMMLKAPSIYTANTTAKPKNYLVDGLLFFHKRTHYSQGRTPLVGWLKPYMLPEILGIPVSPEIIASAPSVNKLTLLKANKDLEDTTDDKTLEEREHAALLKSEKNALMKMETEGKKDRKSKGFKQVEQNGNGIMEGGLEMEIDQSSGRRRKNRRKKKLGDMEVEVPDEAPGEEKIADMA
ncbi:predicted protein [Nematostella vectensis]|uniref:Snurportin-1 n=1 Tax=Nematostella vectensis TaxID=45351 RepID=A7SNW6_NEMVE|nr:predicted protein [Nematostella vectensis]|eukprot:XP_001626736.1 predicted protein [Nematostella vectensis]